MKIENCFEKYRKSIKFVALFALIFTLLWSLAFSSVSYGAEKMVSSRNISILSIDGDNAKINKGGKKTIRATQGMKLGKGYSISTGKNTTVYFQVDDDKAVKLAPSASVVISEASKKKLSITLKSGEMFFNVKKPVAEGDTVEFNAGGTSMGIRGTMGFLSLKEEEATFGLANGKTMLDTGEENIPLGAMEECTLINSQENSKLPMKIEKNKLDFKNETIFVRESVLENNDDLDVISEEDLKEYIEDLEEDKAEAKKEQEDDDDDEEEADGISEKEHLKPAPDSKFDDDDSDSSSTGQTNVSSKDSDDDDSDSGGNSGSDSGGTSSGGSGGGSDDDD